MAKDKEKLFKGADDRAITFQRAVFIVCNLKRLIKRPKKDDKHGSSGSNPRKRSGADGSSGSACGEDDERSGLAGAYNRKRRFKDPVRRAFTLPTMLCNSFSLAVPLDAQSIEGMISQLADFTCNANSSPAGRAASSAGAARAAAAAAVLAQARQLQFQLQQRPSKQSGLQSVGPSADQPIVMKPAPPPLTTTAASESSSFNTVSASSGGAYEQLLAFGGRGPELGRQHFHKPNDNYNSHGSSDLHDKLGSPKRPDRPKQHQLSSLSCLATPVRRPTAPTTAAAGQNSVSITISQQQEALLAELDSRPHVAASYQWSPDWPRSTSRSTKRDSATTTDQQQVCCPLWAYAMAQLDLRQDQPRDQTSYAHLIGAPSPLGYLLWPRAAPSSSEPALLDDSGCGAHDDRCSSTSAEAPSESNLDACGGQEQQRRRQQTLGPRLLVSATPSGQAISGGRQRRSGSAGDSSDGEGDVDASDNSISEDQDEGNLQRADEEHRLPKPQHRRSSNESMERASRPSMRAEPPAALTGASVPASGTTEATLNRQGGNNQRITRNGTANNGLREPHQSTSPNFELGSSTRQQNQLCSDQMRMKRFSSALCLIDRQQQPQQVASSANNNSENRRKPSRQEVGKQQQQKAAKMALGEQAAGLFAVAQQQASGGQSSRKKSGSSASSKQQPQQLARPGSSGKHSQADAAAGLLTPDDPMILARQRRPSASNQGSVNVDQQALFSAVECNQLERAKTILEDKKVNVNSLNGDKLSCLDIAVLMRNVDMAHLLQQYSAKESSAFLTCEGRANQLYALYTEAKRLVEDLSRSLQAIAPSISPSNQLSGAGAATDSCGASSTTAAALAAAAAASAGDAFNSAPNSAKPPMLATGSLLSNALLEEKQRQLQYWKRRLDLFMHMRYEFERLQVPSPPELIVLQVVGESSLGVKIVHSLRSNTASGGSAAAAAAVAAAAAAAVQRFGACDQMIADQKPPEAQRQQQQRMAQMAALRCNQGPKCSHWSLSEFQEAVQASLALQQQRDREQQATGPTGQRIPANRRVGADYVSHDDATTTLNDEQHQQSSEQQIKQQKLVVFNQLLAQQLTLLSLQQQRQQLLQLQAGCAKYLAADHGLAHRLRTSAECASVSVASASDNDNSSSPSFARLQRNNNGQQQLQQYIQRPSLMLTNSTDGAICDMSVGPGDSRQFFGAANFGTSLADSAAAVVGQLVGFSSGGACSSLSQCPSLAYQLMTASVHQNHHERGATRPLLQSRELAGARERAAEDRVIITKYKVEWSLNEQMDPILNSMIVYNTNSYPLECQISGLTNGRHYYVRVSSGNHRGFSEARPSSPISLSPSSWRQVDGNKRRKYDEKVFRKFTKLILLNKHILDDHQPSSSVGQAAANNQLIQQQNSQQQLLAKFLGQAASVYSGGQQNKSSLINMLLLDATTPTGDQLKHEYRLAVEGQASSGITPASNQQQLESLQPAQSSLSVRKNLRNFFQSNSFKFHKLSNQNKRGLYLTTVIYHSPAGSQQEQQPQASSLSNEMDKSKQQQQQSSVALGHKIVVTNDDRLPIIEILNDLVSPAALMGDFYWLLKINGTQWMDIKRLRQQLQKSHSSSTLHLRIKLLSAIEQMQVALNMEDIGHLFYRPIQSHDGSIIICTCKFVSNTKSVSNLSIKWTHQHKIIPRHLRKISDSMLSSSNQQQATQQQQQQQHGRSSVIVGGAVGGRNKSRQERDSTMTIGSQCAILPAATSGLCASGHASSSSSGAHTSAADFFSGASGGGGSDSLVTTSCSQQSVAAKNAQTQAALQQVVSGSAVGAVAGLDEDSQPSRLTASGSEFKLCEHCQYALVQRRCTMASGSSSSSLTSSNESQWSNCGGFNSAANSSTNSSAPATARCTCNNNACASTAASSQQQQSSIAASSSGSSYHLSGRAEATNASANSNTNSGGPNILLSAHGSQRGSTGSAAASSRSGSVIGGTPTHHPSVSSMGGGGGGGGGQRQSQAFGSMQLQLQQSQQSQQQFSAAQKSSTYLMLASLSLYDLLLFSLNEIIEFDRMSTVPLSRGLYLGFVQLQTTVESMRLLVPRSRPNMVPCTRIRDNAHVSREEWQLLKRFASLSCSSSNGSILASATSAAGASSAYPATPSRPTFPGGGSSSTFGMTEQQTTPASRVSDPSIWSGCHSPTRPLAVAANKALGNGKVQQAAPAAMVCAPYGGESFNSYLAPADSSLGFERSRAESVSPGLLQASGHTGIDRSGSRAKDRSDSIVAQSAAAAASDYRAGGDRLSISQKQISSHRSSSMPPTELTPSARESAELIVHSSATDLAKAPTKTQQFDEQQQRDDSPLARQRQRPTAGETVSESSLPLATTTTTAGSEQLQVNERQQQLAGSRLLTAAAGLLAKQQRQQLQKTSGKSPTGSSRLTVNSVCSFTQSPEETFVRLVGSAARRLLASLKSQLPQVYEEQCDGMVSILQSLNDDENNRIYHIEIIELSSQVTFILLIPAPENVCPVTSQEKSNILGDNKDYMLLPLQIFETIHISTYEPELLGKYSRLSAILETDLIVAQHDHRQAFSSNELKSTKSRVSHLQDMVSIADEFWRQLRWIVDVVSFARDKSVESSKGGIKLGTIWRHFDLSPSVSYEHSMNWVSSMISHSYAESGNQQQQQLANTTAAAQSQPAASIAVDNVPEIHLTRSATTTTSSVNLDYPAQAAKSGQNTSITVAPHTGQSNRQQQQIRHHSGDEQLDRRSDEAGPGEATPTTAIDNIEDYGTTGKSSSSSTSGSTGTTRDTSAGWASLSNYCRQHVDRALNDCRVQCTGFGPSTATTIAGLSSQERSRAIESGNVIETSDSNNRTVGSWCKFSGQVQQREQGDNGDDCRHHHPDYYGDNEDDDSESLLDLRLPALDGSEEDEEAIYAYHISLRDATKAASQRKSSAQHSTRPFTGGEPTSPVSGSRVCCGIGATDTGLITSSALFSDHLMLTSISFVQQHQQANSKSAASHPSRPVDLADQTNPTTAIAAACKRYHHNQNLTTTDNRKPELSGVSGSSRGEIGLPAMRAGVRPEEEESQDEIKMSRSIGASAADVEGATAMVAATGEALDLGRDDGGVAGRGEVARRGSWTMVKGEAEQVDELLEYVGPHKWVSLAKKRSDADHQAGRADCSDNAGSRQTSSQAANSGELLSGKKQPKQQQQQQQKEKFKHLKATNPFLSDSFDFGQE